MRSSCAGVLGREALRGRVPAVRAAASWWVPCAVLASALLGTAAPAAPRITALEHRVEGPRERILVFADGPLSPSVQEHAGGLADLVIEGATLDPGAPRKLELPPDASFLGLSAREEGGEEPRVLLRVRHAPGMTPRLVRVGTEYALELPRRVPDAAGSIDLAGRGVQLRQLVTRVSRHTGAPVLFDETLQGDVTIMAEKPFSSSEALLLLDTVLLMKGFAAMPTPGGVRKIVRVEGAPWPFVADLAEAAGDEAVTTLVALRQVKVEMLLQALQPLLGTSTLGFAYAPRNSLILAGSAARVGRIATLVRALDDAGDERIFLRPLRFADVETTADQLQQAFTGDGLVSVWPDTRTNALAVRARAEAVEKLRDFIARLDRPAVARGALHVFPVEHTDPDQLAEILRALQVGDAGRGGAPAAVDPVTGGAALAGAPFAVVVDPPTHSLVVQAEPDVAMLVGDVVAELDRVPRQVDVEVTVLEVATSHGVDLGFDYFLPLTDPDEPDDLIAFVAGLPSGPSPLFAGTPVEQTITQGLGSLPPVDDSLLARFTRTPIFIPAVINGQVVPVAIPQETAAITADDEQIYTKVVLRPRLTVISGEEHEIFVGENVPILTEQADSGSAFLQTRQNVERQDVGVVLRVKPTLGEAGGIVLELTVEVSVLAPSQAGSSAEVGPTIRERTLTSRIRLEHDRVAVIGWHAGPLQTTAESGVPFLRSIPILGWLFRRTTDVTLKNNLLILATAHRDDPEVRALAETLRRELRRESAAAAPP